MQSVGMNKYKNIVHENLHLFTAVSQYSRAKWKPRRLGQHLFLGLRVQMVKKDHKVHKNDLFFV